MATSMERFVNVNRKSTIRGVSYEFGRRLIEPKIKIYGAIFKLQHRVDNRNVNIWIDNSSLSNLLECPDFELKGDEIISPITMIKDNRGRPTLIMIGSEAYDKIELLLSEKSAGAIRKGVRYTLKVDKSRILFGSDVRLMNGENVAGRIDLFDDHFLPDQIRKKLIEDGVEGIYLGSFKERYIRLYPERLDWKLSSPFIKRESDNIIFYLPDYDDFLIIASSARKWFATKKCSVQNIPDKNTMFVGKIDLVQSKRFFSNFFEKDSKVLEQGLKSDAFFITKYAQDRCEKIIESHIS